MATQKGLDGQFSLDKILKDGRNSPRALYPPEDEDVLIIDQHTDENNVVHYQKIVGVMQKSENENGKFNFSWVVTDPNIKELVDNSKHPEKLFNYSPEFKKINPTEDYPDGEYGMVKYIAIVDSNLANDSEGITTKIYNLVKNMVKQPEKDKEVNGDKMEKDEIQTMIDQSIEPMKEKIGLIDEIQEAVSKQDWDKIDKIVEKVEGLDKLTVQVNDLVKNQKQITDEEQKEKDELVKNIKTNGEISEETLSKMGLKELRDLDTKFAKHIKGYGHSTETPEKSVVDKLNEKYGTDIGASLKK